MATPHIEAKKGEIASIVIMPGDPLRAKLIAETYLTDYKQVNHIRNMFAYTGNYKGKRITVMGSGMGMPSIGIYAYELYQFYDVEKIIRIGSCGGYLKDMNLFDIILADSAYTEGNFALTFNSQDIHYVSSDPELTKELEKTALNKNKKIFKGTILTSEGFDFYIDLKGLLDRVPKEIQLIGAEMEAFALFYTAKCLHKKAACLATVVDIHGLKENKQVTAEEREKALNNMIEIALESIL